MLEVLSCQYCEGIDKVISIAGHDSPCGVLHRSQFFAENMQKYCSKDLESCGVKLSTLKIFSKYTQCGESEESIALRR